MAKDSTLLLRRLLPAAFLDPFLAILNIELKLIVENKKERKLITMFRRMLNFFIYIEAEMIDTLESEFCQSCN